MGSLPSYPKNIFDNIKVRSVLLDAARSLSKLDSVVEVLPNIDVLIECIPLQESRLSCSIENIVTSQDEVFRAYSAGEGQSEANIRDVLGYRYAISEAQKGELSVDLIERICSVLKRKPMSIRSCSDDAVYLKNGQGDIVSTPPSGDKVPGLLEELLRYAEQSDDDPLIRVIVFHAYFEMIHPFKDGNGRTGRILNEVLLQKYGLLRRPVLNFSRFLIENRPDYYRVLRKVERDNSWNNYFIFMLSGIKECSDRVISQIRAINDSLQAAYVKCGSAGFDKSVVDQIYSHPYIRAKHLVKAGLVSRNTASVYLLRIEELGILRGEQAGKGKIYLNVDLNRILSK